MATMLATTILIVAFVSVKGSTALSNNKILQVLAVTWVIQGVAEVNTLFGGIGINPAVICAYMVFESMQYKFPNVEPPSSAAIYHYLWTYVVGAFLGAILGAIFAAIHKSSIPKPKKKSKKSKTKGKSRSSGKNRSTQGSDMPRRGELARQQETAMMLNNTRSTGPSRGTYPNNDYSNGQIPGFRQSDYNDNPQILPPNQDPVPYAQPVMPMAMPPEPVVAQVVP